MSLERNPSEKQFSNQGEEVIKAQLNKKDEAIKINDFQVVLKAKSTDESEVDNVKEKKDDQDGDDETQAESTCEVQTVPVTPAWSGGQYGEDIILDGLDEQNKSNDQKIELHQNPEIPNHKNENIQDTIPVEELNTEREDSDSQLTERIYDTLEDYREELENDQSNYQGLVVTPSNETEGLKEDSSQKRLHLFRGEAANTTVVTDVKTLHKKRRGDKDFTQGVQECKENGYNISHINTEKIVATKTRQRTEEEKKECFTGNKGGPLYCSGLRGNNILPEKVQEVTRNASIFLKSIKDRSSNLALFNSGKAFSKVNAELMSLYEIKGNPIIATSKHPEAAVEYAFGTLGGSSGDGRKTPVGYNQNGRPSTRLIGISYAFSLTLAEYKAFRQANMLLDVNVDIGRGTSINRIIEEVTFAGQIPAEFIRGTLVHALPRFDRPYQAMSDEKKRQYIFVYGLIRQRYEQFKENIAKDPVKAFDEIMMHLVKYYAHCLKVKAIKADRERGYELPFIVPYNQQFLGYISDLTASQTNMSQSLKRRLKGKEDKGI